MRSQRGRCNVCGRSVALIRPHGAVTPVLRSHNGGRGPCDGSRTEA